MLMHEITCVIPIISLLVNKSTTFLEIGTLVRFLSAHPTDGMYMYKEETTWVKARNFQNPEL